MDQYCTLMEKYDESDTEIMRQYGLLIQKIADYEEKVVYYEEHQNDLTEADIAYLSACETRIAAKIVEASLKMQIDLQ